MCNNYISTAADSLVHMNCIPNTVAIVTSINESCYNAAAKAPKGPRGKINGFLLGEGKSPHTRDHTDEHFS